MSAISLTRIPNYFQEIYRLYDQIRNYNSEFSKFSKISRVKTIAHIGTIPTCPEDSDSTPNLMQCAAALKDFSFSTRGTQECMTRKTLFQDGKEKNR